MTKIVKHTVLVLLLSLLTASPSSCGVIPSKAIDADAIDAPRQTPPPPPAPRHLALPAAQESRKMVCVEESRPVWLRNACLDGFVVVRDKKVVAQHQGLDRRSREVELIKESCKDYESGPYGPVMVRLFHPKSNTYICLNRRGRVKPMSKRRAEKLGKLCAFYEIPSEDTSSPAVPSLYIQLQSAYQPKWLLGFNGRPKQVERTESGHAVLPPRSMLDHEGQLRHFRSDKCDFRFSTGEYSAYSSSADVRVEWNGLFEHVLNRGKGNEQQVQNKTNSVKVDY